MFQNTIQLYRNAYVGLSKKIWLLSIISFINRAGTMVFPFMTIFLTQSLGFSFKEVGIIMSFFGLGSILGSYGGGWLTDRIGDNKVQFWSLILTSLVLLFVLQADSFWEMAAMAFLLSIVADAFRPASKVAIANASKPENLTRSFALMRLAINLGFAIGPAMGGILAAWKGYDWLFYADSITCLLAAFLFKLTIKDEFKEKATLVDKENKGAKTVTSPYKDPIFMAFLCIICLLAFAFLQMFYTMPVFFKQDFGIGEGQIGIIMGLNGLIIVFLEMPLVYLAEKNISKFTSMAIGAFLIGCGFLCFWIPTNWIGIIIIGIIILTIGEIYYMPFASAFVAIRADDSNRGQYMALYTVAWSVASVIAPAAGFQLGDSFGFGGLWMALFFICILGSIGFWFIGRRVGSKLKI